MSGKARERNVLAPRVDSDQARVARANAERWRRRRGLAPWPRFNGLPRGKLPKPHEETSDA